MADVKAKVKTPKKKASKREKKDWIAAYILIAPVTLGLLVFYIWPFIQNVWFSFNDVNKFNMSTFVGLANYKEMIGDKEVWRTFGKIVYKPNRRTHERPVSAGVSATDGRADMGLLLIFIHRCFVLSSECF